MVFTTTFPPFIPSLRLASWSKHENDFPFPVFPNEVTYWRMLVWFYARLDKYFDASGLDLLKMTELRFGKFVRDEKDEKMVHATFKRLASAVNYIVYYWRKHDYFQRIHDNHNPDSYEKFSREDIDYIRADLPIIWSDALKFYKGLTLEERRSLANEPEKLIEKMGASSDSAQTMDKAFIPFLSKHFFDYCKNEVAEEEHDARTKNQNSAAAGSSLSAPRRRVRRVKL